MAVSGPVFDDVEMQQYNNPEEEPDCPWNPSTGERVVESLLVDEEFPMTTEVRESAPHDPTVPDNPVVSRERKLLTELFNAAQQGGFSAAVMSGTGRPPDEAVRRLREYYHGLIQCRPE